MGGDHRDCEFLLPDGRTITTDGDVRAPVDEATYRRLQQHLRTHDDGFDDVINRALDALEDEPATAAHTEETAPTTGETR